MLLGLFSLGLLATGCGGSPEVRIFDSGAAPERLSDWGLLERRGNRLVLGEGVTAYEVASPLFSDYALKLRTWYLPEGTQMTYRDPEPFGFPVGSVITKTFFYPLAAAAPPGSNPQDLVQAVAAWDGHIGQLDLDRHRLVETRLLIRRADGWEALPYVWDGDDARLRITGALLALQLATGTEVQTLPYLVPARSECASCHVTDHGSGKLELIGVKAWQLNRAYSRSGERCHGTNPPSTPSPDASGSRRDCGAPRRAEDAHGAAGQLAAWAARGALDGLPEPAAVPAGVVWDDPQLTVETRARAYLDANCGHCHSATGAADTSGLHLDRDAATFRALGVCKPPIAAGRGTGGKRYSIVPGAPDESILIYRMATNDPATRMPEIGRAVEHREALALLRDWVAALPGRCI